jgi:hypothetical protein
MVRLVLMDHLIGLNPQRHLFLILKLLQWKVGINLPQPRKMDFYLKKDKLTLNIAIFIIVTVYFILERWH